MSWLSGFLSSGNWIPAVLTAGATIYSANAAAKANKQAAQMAQQAAREQAAAIDRGTALAREQFQAIQQQTAPAVAYQQEAMASPTMLQPWQQQQVEDSRRQALNALSVSGLRGSGRSTVAAVRNVEQGITNQFLEQNRRRADTAASSLANQNFNAAGQIARAEQTGGIYTGNALAQQGVIGADAAIADAALRGKALGDLATVVNDTWKAGRRGEYEPKQKSIGQ